MQSDGTKEIANTTTTIKSEMKRKTRQFLQVQNESMNAQLNQLFSSLPNLVINEKRKTTDETLFCGAKIENEIT